MFHAKSVEEIMKELETGQEGLGEREAELRLRAYGPNEFGRWKVRGWIDLLLGQFKNYLLILLIIAAAVAYAIGHYTDALAICVVVVLNVIFGMALEYSADRSMDELKKLAETKAFVMRGGKKSEIDSHLLVPGDILILEEGMKVPADARIIEEHGLEVNEAALTGESMPVKKNVGKVAAETPLAERSSMLFAGTFLNRGSARAVVVATGQKTEFGAIERTLASITEERTTLEITLEELSRSISVTALVVVGLLFAVGLAFGKLEIEQLFIYSVSMIVAAVPEGMVTVLTLVLAIGVKRMAEEKALVRKLHAVETLGNITFIATDKTGTITEGRMAVVKIYDGQLKDFAEISGTEKIMSYSYLCNSAHIAEGGIVGNETDRAFLLAGIAKGVDIKKFRKISRQVSFKPLDYVKKMMSGVYVVGDEEIAIVKGAPEEILEMCSEFEGRGKMDGKLRADIIKHLHLLTKEGMRAIAVAYGKPAGDEAPAQGLTFLGLLALNDPIRPEVKRTLGICKNAGIRVMMITGDNMATAQRIGHEIGMDKEGRVATWAELERMTDDELDEALKDINIVARAAPASKLRIVERLLKHDEIVAMTGDGVNDAPALKKANVGVVMGRTGTAVSKEVADLVLMDDNFATLEKAVEYGRGITDNIIKFLRFQITTNIALVFLSIPYVAGIRMFEPVQILWINLLIDGPPALTLGLERPDQDVMKRKPRKKTVFIDMDFIFDSLNMAAYMAFVCMVIYLYYSTRMPDRDEVTMVFCTFALMQMFNALNSRSRTEHFYSGLFRNKWLVAAIVAVAAMQVAVVVIPELHPIFGTTYLTKEDFIIIFVASASVLVVGEAKKLGMKLFGKK